MQLKLKYSISVEGTQKAKALMNNFSNATLNVNNSFLKIVATIGGVSAGIAILKKSFDAFIVQRDAVNSVNLALKNMLNQGDLTSEAVQKIASDLQKVSNYGDLDTLQNVLRPLITTGVNSISILDKVTQAIADTAAGTQKSTGEITQMLTKIATGSDESFTRFANLSGINIDIVKAKMLGLQTANERVSVAALLLGVKYEGFAKIAINPLTQLQNTIGDFQLKLGKAFEPVITNIANMGTLFLSNELNVQKLVSGIKVLTVSLLAMGTVNAAGNLLSTFTQLKSIVAMSGETNTLINTLNKLKDTNFAVEKSAVGATNIFGNMQKTMSLTAKGANNMLNNLSGILTFGTKLLGWGALIATLTTSIYQLGKAFGWWGKSVKETTKLLDLQKKKLLERRNVFNESLKSAKELLEVNNRTVAENKELSKRLNFLKSEYGIVVDLENDRAEALKKINDLLDTQKSFSNKESTISSLKNDIAETEKMLDNYTKAMNHWKTFNLYETTGIDRIKGFFNGTGWRGTGSSLSQQGKWFMENKKHVDDYTAKLEELKAELKLLEDSDNGGDILIKLKDLSALSKYYDMVKFADRNYYDWQKQMAVIEADDFEKLLKEKGFSEIEAGEERRKYLNELNKKILQDAQAVSDSYKPESQPTDYQQPKPFVWDTTWQKETLDKQKSAIASYYDTVGALDKGYYDYKKGLIQLQYDYESNINVLGEERAKVLQLKRTADLLNELLQSSVYYKTFYSVINGMQLNFFKSWLDFRNSLIKSFESMISQMLSELIKSGLITLLMNLITPSGAAFKGFGLFNDIFGGLFKTAPIGIGLSQNITGLDAIQTTNVRNSNNEIVNKLNEVILAINVNSIKGKITTIDRIELAQELDVANRERSVL